MKLPTNNSFTNRRYMHLNQSKQMNVRLLLLRLLETNSQWGVIVV